MMTFIERRIAGSGALKSIIEPRNIEIIPPSASMP
jgi:hypothetical protein